MRRVLLLCLCVHVTASAFFPGSKDELRTAVYAWFENPASATTAFGHISTWDTSRITDMSWLFCGSTADEHAHPQGKNCAAHGECCNPAAQRFNEDISHWNTSSATSMAGMFFDATVFNQSIGNWDVQRVTTMFVMFMGAASFNRPLNNWKTSQLTTTSFMFYEAASFNRSITKWNMSQVTAAWGMFKNATSFERPLKEWCKLTKRHDRRVAEILDYQSGYKYFQQPAEEEIYRLGVDELPEDVMTPPCTKDCHRREKEKVEMESVERAWERDRQDIEEREAREAERERERAAAAAKEKRHEKR